MSIVKVLKSFPHAFRGIALALVERNMQVHVVAVVLVTITGVLFELTVSEWLVILLCVGMVLTAEVVNTAFEKVCNHLRDDLGLDYKATRDARDVAAGAVLVSAIVAVLVALIIFLPKLWELFM